MITRILIIVGWAGIAAGIGYFFFHESDATPEEVYQYIARTQQILIVSASLVAGGYVLRFLGRALGIGRYSKCRRCKKRIDKGEMFCFDHRRDSIWDAREKHRIDGAGVIRNQSEKR